MARWLLALGASLALGCAPPAELALDLQTDLAPGVDFEAIHTWLDQRPVPQRWTAPDAEALALGARVGAYDDLAPGPDRLTLRLVDADGDTVAAGTRTLDLSGARATTVRLLVRPRLVAGWGVSCLRLGSRLWCWGKLDRLEPGRTSTERVEPFEVARDVVDVCSSSIETCWLTTDGALSCVQYASTDEPSTVVETSHTGHGHVVLTCAGFLLAHRCFLDRDRRVRCGGVDQVGQLGDGPGESRTDHGDHLDVVGLADVTAIAAGNVHTCALTSERRVACWGSDTLGQIGDGRDGDGAIAEAPVELALEDVRTIDAFWATSCAVTGAGELWCWGVNDHGQVRVGGPMTEPSPVQVDRVSDVELVAVGRGHVCVTLAGDAGGVHCWGQNDLGQLGDGTTTERASPVRVELPGRVVALDAHTAHTCALVEHDEQLEVLCWGTNAAGELGDATRDRSERPLEVALPGLHSQ